MKAATTVSLGCSMVLALLTPDLAKARTIEAQDLATLELGALIEGPVGTTVDSGFNTADTNYGDFSGGAACPAGFATCVPANNPASIIYTYIQTVTLGANTIPNDTLPAGLRLSPNVFDNASAPADPGVVDFFALSFPPAGFNGVAGYDFSQAMAADVTFDISKTANGLVWTANGDWTSGETIRFFFQSTQAPIGPAGFYSVGNAKLTAKARGPLPTPSPQPPTEPVTAAYDFAQTSCAELQALPREEMGYVLILHFGYASGISSQPRHTPDSIDKQIKTAMKNCEKKPEMTVVMAFSE